MRFHLVPPSGQQVRQVNYTTHWTCMLPLTASTTPPNPAPGGDAPFR